MHCRRFVAPPISRRDMLARCANGFGAVAMAALLGDPAYGADRASGNASDPMAPRPPHFPAKAKSVIYLFMDGGPSQVDTFDPKPRLDREHGQAIKAKVQPTQFNNVGKVLKSPWKFRNRGESGIPVSDLFPLVGEHVDDLAIVRSMVSNFSEHTAANYFMHTGNGLQGRPSHGAWVTYGLGSECRDLPGFVVLNGGLIPPGGSDCFGSGFLPASYQGSVFKAEGAPVANIRPAESSPGAQGRKLDLMRRLDRDVLDRVGRHDQLEASIANYELAFKMQAAVPGLMDLAGETPATRRPLRPRRRIRAGPDLRPRVPGGPPTGRARGPVRRGALPQRGPRPMGPARQPQGRPREERPGRRPPDRRPPGRPQRAGGSSTRPW